MEVLFLEEMVMCNCLHETSGIGFIHCACRLAIFSDIFCLPAARQLPITLPQSHEQTFFARALFALSHVCGSWRLAKRTAALMSSVNFGANDWMKPMRFKIYRYLATPGWLHQDLLDNYCIALRKIKGPRKRISIIHIRWPSFMKTGSTYQFYWAIGNYQLAIGFFEDKLS